MRDATDRQGDVLLFINQHRQKNQCNPTMHEIASEFGWASPNAAHAHIEALKKKGIVRKRDGLSRGYIITYPWSERL